jgi:hypothetical protein
MLAHDLPSTNLGMPTDTSAAFIDMMHQVSLELCVDKPWTQVLIGKEHGPPNTAHYTTLPRSVKMVAATRNMEVGYPLAARNMR